MKKSKAIAEAASVPESYRAFLTELKERIQAAQLRTLLSVNRELVLLYWQIGRDILDRQNRERGGAKVIDRLSLDLKRASPYIHGFSPRNLKYMRANRSRSAQFLFPIRNRRSWHAYPPMASC